MAYDKKKKKSRRRPSKKRVMRLNIDDIDYKDVRFLRQFVTERGKIIPRRVTNVSAHSQRVLSLAVRRARQLALIPFTASRTSQSSR